MEVLVYICRSTHLLLVPSCMLPSMEAQHMLGPFSPRGRLEFDEGAAGWQGVISRIDQHSYAVLTRREAKRLLGSNHPCLGPVPEGTSEGTLAELVAAASSSP